MLGLIIFNQLLGFFPLGLGNQRREVSGISRDGVNFIGFLSRVKVIIDLSGGFVMLSLLLSILLGVVLVLILLLLSSVSLLIVVVTLVVGNIVVVALASSSIFSTSVLATIIVI